MELQAAESKPDKNMLFQSLQSRVERVESLNKQVNELVYALRDAGASWADIGSVFGITRQAAHAKWANR
jgi:hypothetical protein